MGKTRVESRSIGTKEKPAFLDGLNGPWLDTIGQPSPGNRVSTTRRCRFFTRLDLFFASLFGHIGTLPKDAAVIVVLPQRIQNGSRPHTPIRDRTLHNEFDFWWLGRDSNPVLKLLAAFGRYCQPVRDTRGESITRACEYEESASSSLHFPKVGR